MYIEKDENDDVILSIDEIVQGTKFYIESTTVHMEVRLMTPEAKTVIVLSYHKKMPDGSFRSTMIGRDEHFGWAVWVLREKGFIPSPPEGTVFEIFDDKTNQPLDGYPVYTTETEAYRTLFEPLYYRGIKGESSLEPQGDKSVEMLLHEMEAWQRFELFGYSVRPVLKKDIVPEKVRQLVTYTLDY